MHTKESRVVGKTFKPGEVFAGPSEALARALRVPGISHAGALVLWLLVSKIGRNDSCWHGQEKLAAELQISVRSLQRLLSELKALGLVQYQQRGVGRSCRYALLWHEAWTAEATAPPARQKRRPTVRQVCRPAVRQIRRTEVSPSSESLQPEVFPAAPLQKAEPQRTPEPEPERSRLPARSEPRTVCRSRVDDDGKPTLPDPGRFATAEDELKALYEAKAKTPMPALVLRNVKENLELRQIPLAVYVGEIRNHLGGQWTNPPGLLITLAKQFVQRTMLVAPPQLTQPQLGAGKALPCRCGGGGYVKVGAEVQHCTCLMGVECQRVDARRLRESQVAPPLSVIGAGEPVVGTSS